MQRHAAVLDTISRESGGRANDPTACIYRFGKIFKKSRNVQSEAKKSSFYSSVDCGGIIDAPPPISVRFSFLGQQRTCVCVSNTD